MIVAIIQDRMGSSRLPGKSLMEIGNKKILQHVIDRTKRIKQVDKVIVAVSHGSADQEIIEYLNYNNVPFYYSNFIDSNNVMLRLLLCGIVYDADYILRIPADQPFFSVKKANEIVKYCDGKNDYIAHYLEGKEYPTIADLPAGTFIEGVKLDALYNAYRWLVKHETKNDRYIDEFKEHVTPFFYYQTQKSKIKKLKTEMPKYLLSINTFEDLERVRKLYKKGIIK